MAAGGGPLLVTVMHLLARLSEAALFRERFAQFVHPELLGSLLEYLPHTHPSPHVSVTGIRQRMSESVCVSSIRHRMSASHASVSVCQRVFACVFLCLNVVLLSQRHACPKRKMSSYYCAVGSVRTKI